MTRRIGHGDPQRGTARLVLVLLAAAVVVFLIVTTMPAVFAAPQSAATGSPIASATTSTNPASPTPQSTATGTTIQLVNPSGYEDPVIMSDKQDLDTKYHFVAWVSNPPSDPSVQFTMTSTTGTPPPSPAVCTGAQTGDTFACTGTLPPNDDYTVKATLFSGSSPVANDTQLATVDHAASSLEVTYPTNEGQLGYYDPPGSAPPGFVMDVQTSSGAENVFAFYSTSPPATQPQWSRCAQQVTISYSDSSRRLACALANNASPAAVTAVGALTSVPDKQPGPSNMCLPTPPSLVCGGHDDSGDAHRVHPYDQATANPTVTLAPTNPVVGRNSDNSQCLVMSSTVADSSGRPIWRANLDVHIVGPTDTAQFASSTGTSPFQPPDANHAGTESTYSCANKNQTTPQEGVHFSSGADTKHIETTTGSDASGQFVFGLHSPDAGQTNVSSWLDLDNDDQLGSEPFGLDFVQWSTSASPSGSSASPTTSATATATATATSSPTASSSGSPSSPPPSSPSSSSTSTTTPGPTQKIETTVSISYDKNATHAPAGVRAPGRGAFKGRVKSAKHGCVKGRTIKLFRFGSLKKTGFSNSSGRWKIFYSNAHGRFYAKAIRKVYVDGTGTKIVCRSDKSPPIRLFR